MTPELLSELRAIVSAEGCRSAPDELLVYECDGLTLHSRLPEAVVLPRSREEVQAVVRACRKADMAFVPRGAGTGRSGGATPSGPAVVIECSRMNRILEVQAEDRYAVVQPGVVNVCQKRRFLPLPLLIVCPPRFNPQFSGLGQVGADHLRHVIGPGK